MTSNSPELNPIDYKSTSMQCYELLVNKIEEIKQQLIEVWQSSNTTFELKDLIFIFRISYFLFCQVLQKY